MELLKKSFYVLTFLGLVLGAISEARADNDSLTNSKQYPHIIYEKLIDGNALQVTLHVMYDSVDFYKIHANQLNDSSYASFVIINDTNVKKGYLNTLHIEQQERKKNYGALIYACAIKAMMDLGCEKIIWNATPNDLLLSQSEREMLPKLIKFYEQLGAKAILIGATSALMELTDFQKAREGIYKILEKWELKDLENSNNTQALQRAAAIVNHIAPK
jgi:tRNA uridine 5-carbamoylmethylation protein Kti12